MTRSGKSKPGGKAAESREERLKAALKANMARRKAQMRARKGGAGKAGVPESGEKGSNEQ